MPEDEKKKVSKAQQAAVNRYMSKNYDRINLTMPKGKKERIHSRANTLGLSVNGYINQVIDEDLEQSSE